MSDRYLLSQNFLHAAGWGKAARHYLAGDASDRKYDRLCRGDDIAVLMDAPPGKGDDPVTFVSVAAHLNRLGLSAPKIFAQDLVHGFLLMEDLGDALFAREIAKTPSLEVPLYTAAADVLGHLHSEMPAAGLPDLSPSDWAHAAMYVLDWYRFAILGAPSPQSDFQPILTDLISTYADGPKVMILRDYHAENLLWLPERHHLARVGLLDFQLAQLGQPGYDLVSLLQDARRDVALKTEKAICAHVIAATGTTAATFQTAYAVLGAQRALRILGVFARLCLVAGKAQYLPLMPRVWGHLQRNLAYPALAPLATICANLLPEPTPANLKLIGMQCGKYPTP